MKLLMKTTLAAAFLLAGPVMAGDPAAGESKSQTCVACHGEGGNSTLPMNPKLAGQYASYLEHALRSYRDGGRKNAIMAAQAAALSDEDIADLAAYFAAQSSEMFVVPKK